MRFKPPVRLVVGALCMGLSGVAMASDSSSSMAHDIAALRKEMSELRAANQNLRQEVGELRTAKGEDWLNERRAEEVKALVKEVLADADTRASLLEGGMTAGHNGKFFLASEDGSFSLVLAGRIQVRYIADFRNNSGSDDGETGFQIRRIKPSFSGHIGNPKLNYTIVLAADRDSGAFAAEEAKIGYKLTDGLVIEGGRFKAPFLREELTSSGRQLAVERTLVNELYTVGFVEGVQLTYTQDMFKIAFMIHDGQNSGETGTAKDYHNDLTDIAMSGRLDIMLAGDWKQWADFTTWSKDEMAIFLGAAFHYEVAETGSSAANNTMFMWTVDGSLEVQGLSLYGAFIGKHVDINGGANLNQYGALAMLAYHVIPDKLEPFVRWEWYNTDGFRTATGAFAGAAATFDEAQLVTVGANYYFRKHDAKFTLDVVWALDPITGSSGLGLQSDSGSNQDQVAIRGQFQLQF